MASCSMRGTIVTLTYWPGQSRMSALAKRAFSRMVPVWVSTALSTKTSSPSAGGPGSPSARTRTTGGVGSAMAALIVAQPALGHREVHQDGVDLGDRRHRRVLGLAHEIADAQRQRAEPAVGLGGDRWRIPGSAGSAAISASSARTFAAAASASAWACSKRCCAAKPSPRSAW